MTACSLKHCWRAVRGGCGLLWSVRTYTYCRPCVAEWVCTAQMLPLHVLWHPDQKQLCGRPNGAAAKERHTKLHPANEIATYSIMVRIKWQGLGWVGLVGDFVLFRDANSILHDCIDLRTCMRVHGGDTQKRNSQTAQSLNIKLCNKLNIKF